ncbi:unnamed protein product, partial [Mesorhabditis belari]|uniref:Integrase catalytic domain-containing protein n=1 Tax=Mesorhabditis belari TaxID=2138241 RepID=A0AAF3J843_9BILA
MQSAPDGDYNFIFVYQDHLTKFVSLRALRTKTAKEIVENIVSIFGTFGPPQILQTDNGREFANKLLEEAVAQWPGCKIVHGKPRHSQSQGSVERANADIEDILSVHQRETKTTEWARFLPLIQYRKNIRYHSGRSKVLSDDDEIQQTSAYEEEKTLQEDNSTRYADLRPVKASWTQLRVVLRNFLNSQIRGIMTPTFNLGLLVKCLVFKKMRSKRKSIVYTIRL